MSLPSKVMNRDASIFINPPISRSTPAKAQNTFKARRGLPILTLIVRSLLSYNKGTHVHFLKAGNRHSDNYNPGRDREHPSADKIQQCSHYHKSSSLFPIIAGHKNLKGLAYCACLILGIQVYTVMSSVNITAVSPRLDLKCQCEIAFGVYKQNAV